MIRRLLVIFLLLLLAGVTKSQPIDSVMLHTRPRPFLSLDSRNSILKDRPVRIFGIKTGLQWRDKYRLGFGYYRLSSRFHSKVDYHFKKNIRSKLGFYYYTIFGEYRFFSNKKWTFNGTFHVGLGESFYKPVGRNDLPGRINETFVLLMEPYVSGTYKIIPWLGIGGGIGLRKTIIPDFLETNNLNGGVVSLNIQVFPIALYKAVFKKTETE